MRIIEYLKSLYTVNDDLERFFEKNSETKVFNKGEVIFESNTYLKHIYFIESGFTRIFYYKGKKEITHYFFGENTFSTGIESVYYQKKSPFGFQALAPCRITLIPFGPIKTLADQNIVMNQIIQKILMDSLISFSKRFYNLQFETALERYHSLIEENPKSFQNASLGHIASYLGISQQTLSVIRGIK